MNLRKVPTREFDPLLLLAALSLVAYGGLLIYSGSLNNYGEPSLDTLSHPVVAGDLRGARAGGDDCGVPGRLRLLAPLSLSMYVISLALLLYVLFAGETEYGASR